MNVSSNAPALRIVDQLDADVAAHVRSVMSTALSPEEQDDRFDAWPSAPDEWETATTPSGFLAVLATCDDRPIGYLGGTRDDGERRQLDALIDGDGASACGGAQAVLAAMLGAVADRLTTDSTNSTTTTDGDSDVVEIWGRPARAWHETVASHHGMTPLRSLHQMRCRLPVEAAPLPTRPYAASDLADLREVNNRAFAAHPDQGSQTVESLTASMAESWFRPEGVRIYEQDGRMAGFCWTKIHPSPPAHVELGEIYVIGVDPDFHGQGLGVPMTAAGLSWLAEQGITTGMLYVEADNVPAIRTYERLGFTVLRTDSAWTWTPQRTRS